MIINEVKTKKELDYKNLLFKFIHINLFIWIYLKLLKENANLHYQHFNLLCTTIVELDYHNANTKSITRK